MESNPDRGTQACPVARQPHCNLHTLQSCWRQMTMDQGNGVSDVLRRCDGNENRSARDLNYGNRNKGECKSAPDRWPKLPRPGDPNCLGIAALSPHKFHG